MCGSPRHVAAPAATARPLSASSLGGAKVADHVAQGNSLAARELSARRGDGLVQARAFRVIKIVRIVCRDEIDHGPFGEVDGLVQVETTVPHLGAESVNHRRSLAYPIALAIPRVKNPANFCQPLRALLVPVWGRKRCS
jgi:hypothetical protein